MVVDCLKNIPAVSVAVRTIVRTVFIGLVVHTQAE